MRRYIRNQEQLDAQGRDEDGDFSESLCTFIWQPLGLLTTVKPPALRERHDFCLPHASLRQPLPQPLPTNDMGSATQWRPCTPAMAAGLTDHV